MHSFFWLYLTINAPDFRLIPLDRNTYDGTGGLVRKVSGLKVSVRFCGIYKINM